MELGPLWTMFSRNYLPTLVKSSIWALIILLIRRKIDFNSWIVLTITLSQIYLILSRWAPQILSSYLTGLSWNVGAQTGVIPKAHVEAFKTLPKCTTCKTPSSAAKYRLAKLLPVIQLPSVLNSIVPSIGLPESLKTLNALGQTVSTKPSMLIKSNTTDNQLPLPIPEEIDNPTKTSVKQVKLTKCDALKQSGFKNDWTWQDVHDLPKGEAEKINRLAEQLAGTSIILDDVNKCYPNYLGQCDPLKPTPIPTPKPKPKPVKQYKPKAICDWVKLQRELKISVSNHYDKISAIMNKDEKDMFLKRRSDLINYTLQKAIVEVQKLIHDFQDQSIKSWSKHLTELKLKSADGYLIAGTSYLVPWKLLTTHKGCFGTKAEGFKSGKRSWIDWLFGS